MREVCIGIAVSLFATIASASNEVQVADAGQLYFPGDGGKPPLEIHPDELLLLTDSRISELTRLG